MATFHSLIAGASFIMPTGKVLRFMGKPGSVGILETADEAEMMELRKMVAIPTSQCTEVSDEVAAEETLVTASINKEIDPALAASVADAAANSERAADPKVSAAQDNLAKLIAAKK